MRSSGAGGRVVRFGSFEADLRAGELRQRGHRLKLEGKPFQVLAALLRNPGELVTREELRAELWSADTFVEFDHGLNTAVNKVRAALGDSAREPKYIETLHRRGYRFVGVIEREEAAPDPEATAATVPMGRLAGRRAMPVVAAVSAGIGIVVGALLMYQAAQWAGGGRPIVAEIVQAAPPPPPAEVRSLAPPADPQPVAPANPAEVEAVRPPQAELAPASSAERIYAQNEVTLAGWSSWSKARLKQLVWVDRAGERLRAVGAPMLSIMYPTASPDGSAVAASAGSHVWVQHLGRGSVARLSEGTLRHVLPIWSPIDDTVLYTAHEGDDRNVFVRAADGSRAAERLVEQSLGRSVVVFDWSRDGKYIVYRQENPRTDADIGYLRRMEDGSGYEQIVFLQTPASEGEAKLSPDGRFVAYCSDESGRREVYVSPFPTGGPRVQASTGGGTQPRWSRDGRELFFVKGDVLMATPVYLAHGQLSLGRSEALFRHRGLRSPWPSQQYDVSADGERFLVVEDALAEQAEGSMERDRLAFD